MLDEALKLLKEFTSRSYKAYIVGGFVRNHLLNIKSNDIDITTNATPKEIKEIFTNSCLPSEDYGSVTVMVKGIRFEITTFRKEIAYANHRKPVKIEYINDLKEDLYRRDFTINTLCMDENGNILDYLDGQKDLNNKIIRSVLNPKDKFLEDSLRILRAVRFATILDFKLDEEIITAIKDTKYLLKELSYFRKKEELDKIFTAKHYKKGIKLLLDLELDEVLEIPNLNKIFDSNISNLIGIWTVLDVEDKYPFNKNELNLIKKIREVLSMDKITPDILYHYGLYVNTVVGEIKDLDIKKIIKDYEDLEIKERDEIDIKTSEILRILEEKPGKYLKEIYDDIEKQIINKKLKNNCRDICRYIVKYKEEGR